MSWWWNKSNAVNSSLHLNHLPFPPLYWDITFSFHRFPDCESIFTKFIYKFWASWKENADDYGWGFANANLYSHIVIWPALDEYYWGLSTLASIHPLQDAGIEMHLNEVPKKCWCNKGLEDPSNQKPEPTESCFSFYISSSFTLQVKTKLKTWISGSSTSQPSQ